jgi:hypothetical protein
METSLPRLTTGQQTVYFQAGGEWCYLHTPPAYAPSAASGPAAARPIAEFFRKCFTL